MKLRLLTLLVLLPICAGAADPTASGDLTAGLDPGDSSRLLLAPVALEKLLAQDARLDGKSGVALRYGVVQRVEGVGIGPARSGGGAWRTLADGRLQWQLHVVSQQATSLEFAFSALRLPHGATLELQPLHDKRSAISISDGDNPADGVYHSALVPGSDAVLVLTVAAEKRDFVQLSLDRVVHGYRDPFTPPTLAKSGSCNIDVVCPEGDAWRDQIASVAQYTFQSGGSSFLCTGQLMATGNSAQDFATPRFSTAHHCVSVASEVQSMVFYWGYQSPTCRPVGSSASGTPLPKGPNSRATQNGATLLATVADSDFTAVQLNAPVPAAATAYFSGWDRSGATAPGSVGIHHPQGHEKRITFNNDPLSQSQSCILDNTAADTHWFISQYEAGTTEGGSSGSGLWNPASRLMVGVLSGGSASCSDPAGFDCYGRLAKAWEGGGTMATRMRDAFDRTGTNPLTMEGQGTCDAPVVSIQSPAFITAPQAGQPVSFSASVSGGAAGARSYSWDVDGDGIEDRGGAASNITVTLPKAQSIQIRVRVTDSAQCSASATAAFDVVAASLQATAGTLLQVCGDNDAAIEPGERWQLPVTLRNIGMAPLPAGARALFAPTLDSVPALPTAAVNNNFGPLDDARIVDTLTLGGTGFRLYGQNYTQAVMSTNGYVSFNPAETGGDFSNDCIGDFGNGSVGPQLRPLHDDLVVSASPGAGLRYRYFASCPRVAESDPNQPQGCHVFQWSRMQLFGTSGAIGDFEFQAVAYARTGQIVYQYASAAPNAGAEATIGLLDAAGTDPLNAACDTPAAAPAQRAICTFAPGAPPAGGFNGTVTGPNTFGYRALSNADAGGSCAYQWVALSSDQRNPNLRLEAAAVAAPALAPGAEATVMLPFALEPGASCGSEIALDYIGTAAPGSASLDTKTVLRTTLAAGASCQVNNACPAQVPTLATRPGLYSDPNRGGNGVANFIYPNTFGGAWYTALADRTPTWYLLTGEYRDHLAAIPITRQRNIAAPSGLDSVGDVVGRAWVAQYDADSLVYAWKLDSGSSGIELMDATPLPFSSPNHTQTWFAPSQPGWGLAIESLGLGGGGALEFIGAYVYDTQGVARWLTGDSASLSGGSVALSAYRVHCPGCPWFPDWNSLPLAAGTLSRTYTGPTAATLDTAITLPAPMSGSWNRSALPITTIGTPARSAQE